MLLSKEKLIIIIIITPLFLIFLSMGNVIVIAFNMNDNNKNTSKLIK
jgi:hypothetical protein